MVGRPPSLAGFGWRPQLLIMWVSPLAAYVSSQHSSWPPPRQVIQETERVGPTQKTQSFISYSQKGQAVTSAALYWSHRPTLVQGGRQPHTRVNTRRRGSLGLPVTHVSPSRKIYSPLPRPSKASSRYSVSLTSRSPHLKQLWVQ